MNKTSSPTIILLLLISLILSGCSSAENDGGIAVIVSLTQTAAAQSTVEAAAAGQTRVSPAETYGTISGTVQSAAPPTPAMTVYALDAASGLWTSVETPAGEAAVPFTLQVPPGNYQVFAFSEMFCGGYSSDGWTLSAVNISAKQTVSGILVSPPSQSQCGSTFGLPASPDGRFAAVPAPSEACKAAALTGIATDSIRATEEAAVQDQAAIRTAPQRIQFAVGADSARVESAVAAGYCNTYLLGASAGQQMNVKVSSAGSISLGAWGVDGSVLLSEAAGEREFHGTLPYTQDYYLEVCAKSQTATAYTLDVHISSLNSPVRFDYDVYPLVQPLSAQSMDMLYSTGVPLILPAEFPVAEGLDGIKAYLYYVGENEFDASLDYGSECRGAGSCHYGSYSVKQANSGTPVSTKYAVYDSTQALPLSLAKGISGYFIPSSCGANCSDAMIFWIYNGYQYMLGLKAASQEQVTALVNAAIDNSTP